MAQIFHGFSDRRNIKKIKKKNLKSIFTKEEKH